MHDVVSDNPVPPESADCDESLEMCQVAGKASNWLINRGLPARWTLG